MHRALTAAILGFSLTFANVGCARVGPPLATHETRTFPAAADKLVRLDVRSLDVRVKVTGTDTIRATVDLDARSSSRAAAQRWIANHTPAFDDSPAELEIHLPSHNQGLFIFGYMNATARLELEVPATCRLEIRTSSGDVACDGDTPMAGTVRVTTSSGDITVAGGVRELVARTSSGDVRVLRRALAALEVDTSSGDVTLDGGAERVTADTSSGDIRLEKLGGDLSARTSSGDVTASWDKLAAPAAVRIHTSSGDVRLRVPAGTAVTGEVETTSGTIRSELAGAFERREHRLTFSASAPAPAADVRTTSGDVTIRTRP